MQINEITRKNTDPVYSTQSKCRCYDETGEFLHRYSTLSFFWCHKLAKESCKAQNVSVNCFCSCLILLMISQRKYLFTNIVFCYQNVEHVEQKNSLFHQPIALWLA